MNASTVVNARAYGHVCLFDRSTTSRLRLMFLALRRSHGVYFAMQGEISMQSYATATATHRANAGPSEYTS